jgi:hypothetical protein
MSLTKLSLVGNNLIIPGQRESLVSDIPVGDEKIANLFYSVGYNCWSMGQPTAIAGIHIATVYVTQESNNLENFERMKKSGLPHICKYILKTTLSRTAIRNL